MGSGFPKSHNISKAIDKRLGGTPKRGRFLYKNGKTAGGERIGQLAGGAEHYESIPRILNKPDNGPAGVLP